MEITLDQVINYLENSGYIVFAEDNSFEIINSIELDKNLSNKDLRLIDDIIKDYVKVNNPLFSKITTISDRLSMAHRMLKINLNEKKYVNVPSFKKINTVRTLVYPIKGEPIQIKIIRKRKKQLSK